MSPIFLSFKNVIPFLKNLNKFQQFFPKISAIPVILQHLPLFPPRAPLQLSSLTGLSGLENPLSIILLGNSGLIEGVLFRTLIYKPETWTTIKSPLEDPPRPCITQTAHWIHWGMGNTSFHLWWCCREMEHLLMMGFPTDYSWSLGARTVAIISLWLRERDCPKPAIFYVRSRHRVLYPYPCYRWNVLRSRTFVLI